GHLDGVEHRGCVDPPLVLRQPSTVILIPSMPHPELAVWPRPPRAPRIPTLQLIATFRTTGWRARFQAGDGVEVWADARHLGTLPLELLVHLVWHHLQAAPLPGQLQAHLAPMAPAAPRLPAAQGRRLRGHRAQETI